MKQRSLERFTRRVWFGLLVVAAYLVLLAGITGVTQWRSHQRLREETGRRALGAARELAELSPRARRFLNPQPYPVGLDPHVHARKQQLIAEARAPQSPAAPR